jgi:hypothetical protein
MNAFQVIMGMMVVEHLQYGTSKVVGSGEIFWCGPMYVTDHLVDGEALQLIGKFSRSVFMASRVYRHDCV